VHYQGGTGSDAAPVAAASTELYGVPSGTAYVVMTENNTSVTYYRSDGTSTGPDVYNVGDVVSISGGSQGNSSGVRVVADKPVNVQSHADADGSDMTAFYPKWALARSFIIPRSAEYCVIVPEESGATITVANSGASSGVSDGTYGGGGMGSSPGFKHFGSTSNVSGSIAAGTTFYCDVPAFCYYEPDDDDEGNLNGDSSALFLEADESTTATLHAVHRYGCVKTRALRRSRQSLRTPPLRASQASRQVRRACRRVTPSA